MLDKNAVIRTLSKIVPDLIVTIDQGLETLQDCLTWLTNNDSTIEQLGNMSDIYWTGKIDQCFTLKNWDQPYRVVGIDGSQIYPDKHQGLNCFLLNIGYADFYYADQSSVILHSIPEIYLENALNYESSPEMVNYLRTEREFSKSFDYCTIISKQVTEIPFFCLFDGPLYFWYLQNKSEEIMKRFLPSYLSSLDLFYGQQIPLIGFLSAPKNRDIIELLKNGIEKNIIDIGSRVSSTLDSMTDIDLISLFLPSYTRTTLFNVSSSFSYHYPPHLRPSFCYVHVKSEIIRLEFPYWLTQHTDFEAYLSIIIDQCLKGNGYPIALSEAHEQAVVKNYERDFFFDLLHKIALNNGNVLSNSQKSIKKRIVGV